MRKESRQGSQAECGRDRPESKQTNCPFDNSWVCNHQKTNPVVPRESCEFPRQIATGVNQLHRWIYRIVLRAIRSAKQ